MKDVFIRAVDGPPGGLGEWLPTAVHLVAHANSRAHLKLAPYSKLELRNQRKPNFVVTHCDAPSNTKVIGLVSRIKLLSNDHVPLLLRACKNAGKVTLLYSHLIPNS